MCFPSEGQFVTEGDLLFQVQRGVDLLGRQQAVPLSDWPPRVRQHVGPVSQLVPCGVAAQEYLPHGIISGHGVVVPQRDDQVHPLRTTWKLRVTTESNVRLCWIQFSNGFSHFFPVFSVQSFVQVKPLSLWKI